MVLGVGSMISGIRGRGDLGKNEFWILLDSGSMMNTCEKNRAQDIPLNRGSVRHDLRDVQHHPICHYGSRKVDVTLGDAKTALAEITFEVSDVAHPVLSLGKMLAGGAHMVAGPKGGHITMKGERFDIQLHDNVLLVKGRRTVLPECGEVPLRVAPVVDDGRFQGMMAPFDQDAEEAQQQQPFLDMMAPLEDEANLRPQVPHDDFQGVVLETDVQADPMAQAPRRPLAPSQAEQDLHFLTHLPFAPWCEQCVAAKGRDAAYRASGTDERVVNLIVGDYCYFGNVASKKETLKEGPGTVLVVADTDSGSVLACQARIQGKKDPYVVAAVVGFLASLGTKRVTVQTDGEPAIKDLMMAVKAAS